MLDSLFAREPSAAYRTEDAEDRLRAQLPHLRTLPACPRGEDADRLCPVKWCNSATDVLALVYATGTSRLSWSAASAGRKSACIDSALT